MSEFSQMLSKFIKERDTNIYMLAKYCNYDRANMYKLTSGKRNAPDLPFVKKLAEYMHDEAYEKWFADVTEYNLSYDCDSVLELMDEVKEKLNS